jgi:hypothetical protein
VARHWSEQLSCFACGKAFRSAVAEARHRHNFPVLCTRNKAFEAFMKEHGNG